MALARKLGIVLTLQFLVSCAPTLPPATQVDEARWLGQNWSDDERFWFHHASQGTSTLPVPYDWFVALEQPSLAFFGDPGLLTDPDYLARFGFIPSPTSLGGGLAAASGYGYDHGGRQTGAAAVYDRTAFEGNPDALPVGFARTRGYQDPATGAMLPDQIGLTCAACHTGHLEYGGISVRIDGAPAIASLGKFRETLGWSLAYARYSPFRFGRFADRVLGENHTGEAETELKAQLEELLDRLRQVTPVEDDPASVDEGFGRLDALNRIGNQVFYSDLSGAPGFDPTPNRAPLVAPVNFPHIWNTPWFDWVQYDASIMQPMVRNAGEALGVRARINLSNPDRALYRSSVQVRQIYEMEQLIAGDDPHLDTAGFKGLRSPRWPADVLGELDPAVRERGRALYREVCQGCHLPPVDEPSGEFWSGTWWTPPDDAGRRYLKLKEIPIRHLGTDPAQAQVIVDRQVRLPAYLGVDPEILCDGPGGGSAVTETSFAAALAVVVEKTTDAWYDDNGIGADERTRMNGYRPNCIQAKMVYKARPLNGVWATAPFLHNGAVPTLWDLLSPLEERPTAFCLGSREFDPEKVGYRTDCIAGAFELDTTVAGNRNTGHEFRDGPREGGVIGRALDPDERWALIEYLKGV